MAPLLVIGNGFDQSLKAKTSYSQFFDSKYYSKIKGNVIKWIESVKTLGYFAVNSNPSINFVSWDILFYLRSLSGEEMDYSKNIKWCDVEKEIYNSLIKRSDKSFDWDVVYDLLQKFYSTKEDQEKTKNSIVHHQLLTKTLVLFFIKKGYEENVENKDAFYKCLLQDLNTFEKRFGEYIFAETNDEKYRTDAAGLANGLVGTSVKNIDSFNYSSFANDSITIRHINGDYKNPIFGIDASIKELKNVPEIRYFTKTSRRIYQDSYGYSKNGKDKKNTITEAVVYGHSLNEQDYDYFNYLFTVLKFNTLDVSQMGKITFLFSVYDKNRGAEIRNAKTEAIYALINAYEDHVNHDDQRVLLNLLRFSGKLVIKEISAAEAMNAEIQKRPIYTC